MKSTYKLLLSLSVFTTLGLTSCLKDDKVDNQAYGMINLNANNIVEITANSSRSKGVSLPIQSAAQIIEVPIHLAAENSASSDVKVSLTLSGSQAFITAYNAVDANKDGTPDNNPITLLPTSYYTTPNGLDVTIAKGAKDAVFNLGIITAGFDPANTYGVLVKIAAVDKDGFTISGNYNYQFITIAAKNKYDGIYTVTGTLVDALGSRVAKGYPKTVQLRTTAASQVAVYDNYAMATYGYPLYVYGAATDSNPRAAFGIGFNFNLSTNAITSAFDADEDGFTFTLGSGATNNYSNGVIKVQWITDANASGFPVGRFTVTETYTFVKARP